jgi:hypothetical protein
VKRGDNLEYVKNIRDDLSLGANLEIMVNDAITGDVLRVERIHNLVVTSGRNLVRDFLNSDTGLTGLTHVAISTSTSIEAASDTGIGAEVHRAALTQKTKSDASLNCKYYLQSGDANGYTITKIGLFGNGATTSTDSGTFYAEGLFTAIIKTASISVTFSWDQNQIV